LRTADPTARPRTWIVIVLVLVVVLGRKVWRSSRADYEDKDDDEGDCASVQAVLDLSFSVPSMPPC
jgi:hypothetical protein